MPALFRSYTRMLPQQPVIRLLPCQTRAVDAALLTRADANRLTVLGVADGIRLRVFEHNQRHNQVALGIRRQVVIRGHEVVQQILINHKFIAPLLERDAEHLLVLNGRGTVGRVNLNNIVIALLLHFQQRQRLVGVARGDDAVGHLALEVTGRVGIAPGFLPGHREKTGRQSVGTWPRLRTARRGFAG